MALLPKPTSYTWRYSTEATATSSIYCPICRKKKTIANPRELRTIQYVEPDYLCCSTECLQLYLENCSVANVFIFITSNSPMFPRTLKLLERYNATGTYPDELSLLLHQLAFARK